jgi:hypothetical protein
MSVHKTATNKIVSANNKIRVSTIDSFDALPNLFADFDLQRQSVADGTLVPTLTDWKNGNDLTQSDSAKQMKYKYNQANGYSAIQKYVGATGGYYGINSNLESAWFVDVTIAMSCYLGAIPIVNKYLLASSTFANNTKGFLSIVTSDGGIFYAGIDNFYRYQSPVVPFIPNAWNTIIFNIKSGGNSYISVNDIRKLIISNTPTYLPSTLSNIWLGITPNSNDGPDTPFSVSRLLIYKRSLSEQEEGQVKRLMNFTYKN